MPTIAQPPKKKNFVLHTPAWLDQRQTWITDGARHLYKTLLTLADQRTGRLYIAGRGWIKLQAVERKAGISHNTRKKYFRELATLDALKIERPYVIRVIDGRRLKVLGESQVTIFPLVAPHLQTKSRRQSIQKEPQHCVSPVDQNENSHKQSVPPTDQIEKTDNLATNSPTVGGLVGQFLSPTSECPSGSSGFEFEFQSREKTVVSSSSSSSTTPKPDDDDDDVLKILKNEWENRRTDPYVLAWAKEQILGRSNNIVRNEHAYLHKALPEFMDNLAQEIESWLLEGLYGYILNNCFNDAPGPIGYIELQMYLECRLGSPGLPFNPLDEGILDRIFEAAFRKVKEAAGSSALAVCPFGFVTQPGYVTGKSGLTPLRNAVLCCVEAWPHPFRLAPRYWYTFKKAA